MARADTNKKTASHMLLYVGVLAFVIVMAAVTGHGHAFGEQRGKSNAVPTSDTVQQDAAEQQAGGTATGESASTSPTSAPDGETTEGSTSDGDATVDDPAHSTAVDSGLISDSDDGSESASDGEQEPGEEDNGLPHSDTGYLVGVDVSEWNSVLDWETIQSGGIQFAILRCGITVGDDKSCEVDEQFKRNVAECERLGIPYGVYYFSAADDVYEAKAEARFVLSVIKDCNPTLPVFIDLEQSYMGDFEWMDTIKQISQAFCTTVAAAGYKPGIYASVSWWEYLMTDPCYDQWSKWVADYSGSCTYSDADCWQYTSKGEIYGTDWLIDLNIWYL